MNVIPIVKLVTGTISSMGAKEVLKLTVKKVTKDVVMSKSSEILVKIGEVTIATTVGAAVAASAEKIVTEVTDFGKETIQKIKSMKTESEEVLPRET
jgi:hypothetical protein